ncbi:MAG: tetratricopeptide repeat protein [Verrucomicrobia bacterium]|nr:tetratricopeptide repeat protein [Verrucomicrobiota bacterium]
MQRAIITVVALAVGSLLTGCATSSQSSRAGDKVPPPRDRLSSHAADLQPTAEEENRIEAMSRYARGIIHEMNEEPAEAFSQFYQAVLKDPQNEVLALEVARHFIQRKQPEKAIEVLNKAAGLPGASGSLDALLGLAYAQLGKNDLAIAAGRNAIRKLPRYLPAYQSLSQLYLQMNQPQAALELLDEAGRQPDVDAGFLVELAENLAGLGGLRKLEPDAVKSRVIALLDRAESLKPDDAALLEKLADGYKLMGEIQKALAVYERVLTVEPDFLNLRAKLIDLYLATDDKKRATEQLEAIIRDKPTNPAPYFYLGVLAQEEKKFDRAKDYLEKAVLLSPDNEQYQIELALINLNARKPKDALAVLEKARARFKQSFALEFYSGIACSALKKYDQAVTHYTTAEVLAQATDSKKLTHVFYFQVGSTYERKQDFASAEKYFEKCLAIAPKFTEALNYCGYMWAERGVNLEKARTMIEQAVALEPKNAAFLDSLGWVLYQLKQPAQALPHLLKSLELIEEPDATICDHAGDVYAALKNVDKAREFWRKALGYLEKQLAKREDEPEAASFELLGDLLAKLEQPERAREAWHKANSLEPSDKLLKKLESHASPPASIP